ncbi:LCP family protein [Xylanimonas ulmi]|uniref:LytR family transcriptional attenuator n=1 Tax=Xylanimonas ulmi TaxID=228973 RepID=A0A4Q7LXW3_9MICO|nr:LCP family protein [Xylanibacterium ulmi]RZS59916.1 LytR family transcriptional attenuator [Xylanibacterium ulmi]
MTDTPRIPPSFSPSGTRQRPPGPDGAVPVHGRRGDAPAPRATEPDDAVVGGDSPRVRRQSSREVPVTPPERRPRIARPQAFPPGATPRASGATPRGSERRGGEQHDAAPSAAPQRPSAQRPSAQRPSTQGPSPAGAPRAIPPRRQAADGASAAAPRAVAGRSADAGRTVDAGRAADGRPTASGDAPRGAGAPRTAGASRTAGTARPHGAARPSGAAHPHGTRSVAAGRLSRPASADGAPLTAAPGRRRRRKGRVIAAVAAVVLVLVLAWPVGLLIWANGKIQHIEALSGAPGTPGTTYLLAGSDARGSGGIEDETTGARTDTIMLLHKPSSGPAALLSLPRDSFVEIPGHGSNKLNAAFAFGGAPLLVATVEHLTGLTVDHYVEVGFGGIADVVDAVDGVNLCLDLDVNDANSGLQWTSGCHDVDGATAIAFSRMRYSDPQGDIGRTERQRQLISAVTGKVADPGLIFRPSAQVSLADAGLGALTVDEDTNILNFVGLALAFRAANGPGGVTGTPWIASVNYRPGGGVGSTVQLDAERNAQLWADLRDGNLTPGQVGGMPS